MANLKAGTLIGGNMIWNVANLPLNVNGDKLFINKSEVYTTTFKPTPADVGAVNKAGDTMTGVLAVNAEIKSKSSNSYRMSDGIIGTFWRKDGNDLYLMRTESNQAESGTYSSHRPFSMNLATAKISMGNGLYVAGGLEIGTDLTLGNKFVKGANSAIVMRDHGNGNVTLSASVNSSGVAGDLYLGYNAAASGTAGHNTRSVRLESSLNWKGASTIIVDSNGKINSENMAGPIRTEKDASGVWHTVVGGTDTVNRGRTIIVAGECGKQIADNTTTADERVHIGADASDGVYIHTNLQSGWASRKSVKFANGELFALDGTKRVFRQGWDFGLGCRQGTAANAADYTEDKTLDFNKLITAGEFSVSGNWMNGLNIPEAQSHTGFVKVEVRYWSAGPAYVQTFTYQGAEHVARAVRYGTGTYPNVTWKKWVRFGPYEVQSEYRVTVNRGGETVYPYMSIVKKDIRTDMTSGYYIAGALQFKENPTDASNPDSGRPLFIVRADTSWNQGLNRGILQLRKASDSSTASEIVMYEDNVRIIHNGKANTFRDTGADFSGTLTIVGKLMNNAFTTTNKQILNGNSNDYVYVGNPTIKKMYLETDANAEVYVNAAGSAKRVYHEGKKPTLTELGAAPSGYGLGTSGAKVPNKDCNQAVASGFYGIYGDDTNTPYTTGPSGSRLLVVAWSTQHVSQTFTRVSSGETWTRTAKPVNDVVTWTPWVRVITSDQVNESSSGAWSDIAGKIPKLSSAGVIELGRYIDMRTTNSTKDFDIRLEATATSLDVFTQHGKIQIGAMNGSHAHIYTDRGSFYMNKKLNVAGDIEVKSSVLKINNNGRKHIQFSDSDSVTDGYIWKDPGAAWNITHGDKASSTLQWTANGELVVDGARWAATHSHAYAGQPGTRAPVHVDFGMVPGDSDYYPIVRGVGAANTYGYTTQVDLGMLRQGANSWGYGILRVGSHESSSHPSATFTFDISGNFGVIGNITAFSDIRVKKNIKVIENALDKIDQIRGVTYDRTDMEVSRQMGVIAQEVEKVAPEVVSECPHSSVENFKAVAYGNLAALLIEGIKELRSELNDIKAHLGM